MYSNKKTIILNCKNFSQYYPFNTIYQINAALASITDFLKTVQNLTTSI